MIAESSQISLGVRIQAVLKELRDDGSLGLEGPCRDIHQVIQSLVEVLLICRQICDTGHVDRDNADGTCGLAGSEESAGFLAQLAKVKTESAAHGADIAGLHVGVDVVGEIGRAVFRSHFEQQLVVLCLIPVEISGDGVCGDRILESSAVGVAFDHDLDEGLVHHIHFLLAVAVGEVHLLAADDRGKVLEVVRNSPVQSDVGERSLCAPSAGCVHAVDEGLHALLDFLLGQVVDLYERCQVCVKR